MSKILILLILILFIGCDYKKEKVFCEQECKKHGGLKIMNADVLGSIDYCVCCDETKIIYDRYYHCNCNKPQGVEGE